MQDTRPEQQQRHARLLRKLTPGQRARALKAVDGGVRRMAMIRLRLRHPAASQRELVIRHVAAVHGVATARKLYGSVPPDLAR